MGCIASLFADAPPSPDEVQSRLAKVLNDDLGTGAYECGNLARALIARDGVAKLSRLLKNHEHFSPVPVRCPSPRARGGAR